MACVSSRRPAATEKGRTMHIRGMTVDTEMKVFEGLTGDEIAPRLGCTRRTVSNSWSFARSWLQEEWAAAGRHEQEPMANDVGRSSLRGNGMPNMRYMNSSETAGRKPPKRT